jgi:hypothetical protein
MLVPERRVNFYGKTSEVPILVREKKYLAHHNAQASQPARGLPICRQGSQHVGRAPLRALYRHEVCARARVCVCVGSRPAQEHTAGMSSAGVYTIKEVRDNGSMCRGQGAVCVWKNERLVVGSTSMLATGRGPLVAPVRSVSIYLVIYPAQP